MPNSFKGCLNAFEVCDAIAIGIHSADPNALIEKQPIADGGHLTTEILVRSLGGKLHKTKVKDPLNREIEATYGILPKGIGVMEMCAASGLHLLNKD